MAYKNDGGTQNVVPVVLMMIFCFFSLYQMMSTKIPCRRCIHIVGAVGDDVRVNESEFTVNWIMMVQTPMKRGYKETKRYIREVKGNNEKQQKFL
jgi:hypothetical protein